MKSKHTTILQILAAAFVLAAAPAVAQDHIDLGTFKAWQAYQYQQGAGIRCTMASQPERAEGNYTSRGPIWAYVMHRPSEGATGEVGFHMGYPIKANSQVTVKVGTQTFQLFTQGEGAYAWPDDEPKLIRAMRRGASMVVKGTSARGTDTTDTYSLSGFTAASKSIDGACSIN